ncbi:protein of unknown function [Candidatus Nitrotoga arctica]|uniref:Secreted protein n=1 Tax=Candidatus Nitrotoga arctica TaxID=453162 RepID=A0ABN8AKZ4_9PROT|nr:protein of unknown function [Candidatus Nitrotoga arctica]
MCASTKLRQLALLNYASSYCIFAGKPKLTVVLRFTSEQACWVRMDTGIRNRSAAATTNCVFPI